MRNLIISGVHKKTGANSGTVAKLQGEYVAFSLNEQNKEALMMLRTDKESRTHDPALKKCRGRH